MTTQLKIKIKDNHELRIKIDNVRQASFKIHKIARGCFSEIEKSAFRTAGHAVASGHMREYAMVASDYAIKTIGLIAKNDTKIITKAKTSGIIIVR